MLGDDVVAIRSESESALAATLAKQYYAAGYWRSEDLWTSFCKVAAADPGATAFQEGQHQVSFAELLAKSESFGAAVLASGCRQGDVLIVHGRHCIESVIAVLGCSFANLVVAILPAMFSARQIGGIIQSTQARAIVTLGEETEIGRATTAAKAHGVATVVTTDSNDGVASAMRWSEFVGRGRALHTQRAPASPDAPSLLTFSSGTTGTPKGVIHSANTLRYAVETYCAMQNIGRADTSLVVCAFGFVGSSILGVYLTFLAGCRTILMRTWEVDQTLHLIESCKVTHFLLMPTHAIDILNAPRLNSTDCSSLYRGVVAGLSEAHRLDARKRLCARPFPMYGMSESPGHVTGSMDQDWDRLRTAEGRCLPGAEVLICDDEDNPLPAGTPGNILVRGPNRFLGYYGAEQLTRDSISSSGYFRTGDVGFVDADGYMTFVSRSKDIIRRGGITITPSDIETVLRTHPRIADVAVIALPDPRFGERPCACVITRDSQDMSLQEITHFLASVEFAKYLWPEVVQRCESFPRTPSLKVKKNELRALVMRELAIDV
jgi:acyl-CoA synthetase (AMP-forming)/AMP-acid ligase II